MAAMVYSDFEVHMRASQAHIAETMIRVSALDRWDAMRLASDKYERSHGVCASRSFCSGVREINT